MIEAFESPGPTVRKRNSCKAVVVRRGRLLLTLNRDSMGDFHLLPGGGQKFGETATDTVVREVIEETGWQVAPRKLILVRDYIGGNHEFSTAEGDVHQTELIFTADPVKKVREPEDQDAWQTGVLWLPLNQLCAVRLYPSCLCGILPDIVKGNYEGPVYLGDVN